MGIPAQVLQQAGEEEVEDQGNPEEEVQETEEVEVEETQDSDAPEPDEEAAPQKDEQYWEQRFRVMEGKFKSEVPRLSEQVRDLTAQNNKLTDLIANLNKKKEPEITGYLTDEEFEKLEDEGFERSTIDLIGSMAERIAEKRLSKYDQKFETLSKDVETSSKDRFFSALAEKVPDWETINVDEGFIEWLSKPDGYSGNTKQQSLNIAYSAMDANRVAAIFNAYKAPSKPASTLIKQVAPGKGAATQTPVSSKKMWSKNEITKFYSDQIKGRYSEKEGKRIEKDIFDAQKEGRITT